LAASEEPGEVTAKIDCGGSIEAGHKVSPDEQATRKAAKFTAVAGKK